MNLRFIQAKMPKLANVGLVLFSVILMTLSFPDFDLWFLAWFGLVPLFVAIDREKKSIFKSTLLGWLFGIGFFYGTCWWLSFAMITYGGIPPLLAYFLVFVIVAIVGLSSALFAGLFSILLRRLGSYAIFAGPFLWTAIEFGRYHIAFNNWNQIAYSQAFNNFAIQSAQFGGIYLVGFLVLMTNAFLAFIFLPAQKTRLAFRLIPVFSLLFVLFVIGFSYQNLTTSTNAAPFSNGANGANVVAIQANVPMSGLNYEKWLALRDRHVKLAEDGLRKLSLQQPNYKEKPLLIVFSESPMNFMYAEDSEFREFIGTFARNHNAYVLFNSAEPNQPKGNYFNSAVLVSPQGDKIGQYDKIFLVPFGEYAPVPESIQNSIPVLVGSFELGKEYDLFDIGDVKAGIVICYESDFPTLSREFVKNGADVLIEMTNDGYLGKTGVLRQHLAGAIFRAVETNRPLLRTTNVGITAYINERGEVLEASQPYTEDIRVWSMQKSDGSKSFYVRYGDWFAWLSIMMSLGLLILSFSKRDRPNYRAYNVVNFK
jgi:apolipoprotein N-acyltransferase